MSSLMKRNTQASCIFLVLLLPTATLAADLPESLNGLYTAGNNYYQSGDFASAERVYRKLEEAGVDSGYLYYNLANACFKQKKLGEAIYFWEKSLQRLPGDPEVIENLELAQLLVVDRIEVPADPLPVRLLSYMVHFFPIRQESWILLILFVIANVLFGFHFLLRKPRTKMILFTSSLLAGTLLVLVACSLGWKIYQNAYRREAIVVEQRVDIRSGPSSENITVVTVHEGIKVRVHGETSGWYQVSLPNGWTGWLKNTSIRIL